MGNAAINKVDKLACSLTVYFEDPFWVGIFEKQENKKLFVSKVTFGAEPKDYEVYAFVLSHFYDIKYSQSVKSERKEISKNPKKMQRDANKMLKASGVGTKSQQALKLLQEQNKKERKEKSKEQKIIEEEKRFALRRQKQKEKHKGR